MFTRIIHPQTGHVVNGNENGDIFYLDDTNFVGNYGSVTSLTSAISNGTLLPANIAETTPQNVVINGTLIINQDYTFANGSSITMGEESTIKIGTYKKLKIQGSTISSCDNEIWNGILVDKSASLDFFSSTIENAITAIEMKNLSIVRVYNSGFDYNEVGIGCYGQTHKEILLQLLGNIWLGSSGFSNGEYGIKLENVNEFFGGQSTSYSNMETAIYLDKTDFSTSINFFWDCNNGIVANNSPNHINVSGCSFNDVQFGINVDGAPICNINWNDFEQGESAISIKTAGLDEVYDIEYNLISDYEFGVYGRLGQSRGNIMKNTIYTKFFNVSMNGIAGNQTWATQYNDNMATTAHGPFITNVFYRNISDGRVFQNEMGSYENGIKIEGGTFNNIGYNYVSTDDNLPAISLKNSDLSSIYCNNAESYNGSGIVILSNNSGSDIRGNDTKSSDMGLQYGTSSQTFAHTGKQEYKGNTFDDSTPQDPKAINYSASGVAKENQYILGLLAGDQGTEFYPYFTSNFSRWFDKDGQEADYVCTSGGNGNGVSWDKDDYKDVVKKDTALVKKIKKEYGDGGILVDAEVKTVEHILDYWELGGNMFNDVMQDIEYQEAVQLATLKHQLNNVLTTVIITEQEADTWIKDMNDVLSLIDAYETFTYDPVSDSVILHTNDPEYLNLLYQLDTTKARFSIERTAKQANVDALVSGLIARCDALPRTGSDYAKFYLDILSLSMRMQLSGFNGFTASQKNLINVISEECSYYYADPVFLARALRATYDTELMREYDDDCSDEVQITLRNKSKLNGIEVFPNPTSKNMTILLQNNNDVVFEVINSVGEVIDIISVDRSLEIDVSNYTLGIYFLKDISGTLDTKKFSVVR